MLLKLIVVNIIEINFFIYWKKFKDLSNILWLFCVVLKYSIVVLNRILDKKDVLFEYKDMKKDWNN